MVRLRKCCVLLLAGLTVGALAPMVMAHGPVPRVPDVRTIQARLFAADTATGAVLAIDLPEGTTVARLATPPAIIVMGLSGDERYLLAARGRNTDRDWVTVIATAFDTANGQARSPYVARTFLGHAFGNVEDGHLYTVGGKDAVFMEGVGELEVIESGDYTGLDRVQTRTYKLPAPDHYHYLEAGDNLYVGFLAKGMIDVLNRESGAEVTRITGCPVLHGMARDEVNQRLLFACQKDVVAIGTRGKEANQIVSRIAYPQPQRIGGFMKGKDRVLWGSTEGAVQAIYRLDTARKRYKFDVLTVPSSIQQNTNDDGSRLLLLTREGVLEIRDGGDGKLLSSVAVCKPFDAELHEHVDKAILPDIQTLGTRAFVSLPHEGRIVEVNLERGEVVRYLETGGSPTRLVLVHSGP